MSGENDNFDTIGLIVRTAITDTTPTGSRPGVDSLTVLMALPAAGAGSFDNFFIVVGGFPVRCWNRNLVLGQPPLLLAVLAALAAGLARSFPASSTRATRPPRLDS